MRFTTLVVAASGLMGSALAIPTADAAAAAAAYNWSVSKWAFCADEDDVYNYSFNIEGKKNGAIPKFKATCTGTQTGGYRKCTVQGGTSSSPKIFADVNIVNDSIARVRVQMTYVDSEGCTYQSVGSYDAEENCGSTQGSTFKINPTDTAVC